VYSISLNALSRWHLIPHQARSHNWNFQ